MLQELVVRLAAQHRLALARLHGEVQVAYDEALAMHSTRFPDPRQIPGGTLCGDVRAIVLAMNGIDALTRSGESPRTVPPDASCGPDSTLTMASGPNSAVRLGDPNLARARLRKLAAKVVNTLELFSPRPAPDPKPGRQMVLDDGQPRRVLGPAGLDDQFDLVAYWWPTPDRTSVAGGILAAVADIDTSEERILALTPLPPAIRPKTVAEKRHTDYEPPGDFEQHLPEKSSETGDSEA